MKSKTKQNLYINIEKMFKEFLITTYMCCINLTPIRVGNGLSAIWKNTKLGILWNWNPYQYIM